MYTGLSYTDYLTLNQSHILKIEQGAYIKKKRNKTDIYQIIPILPQTKIILDKYKIDNLPRPDMSDLNKELKYLQELCSIPESLIGFRLSTSVFRETFATMMENEYMLPTRVIMTMMGHSTTKQLNTYSNIMPSRIHHDLSHSIPNWQDIIAA
jgi:integrase